MIITDGKSQDAVEEHAQKLRNIGVEIFVLGMFFLNSVFCEIMHCYVNVFLYLETIQLFHWSFSLRFIFASDN